ncbi:hypothetical protein TSAR_011183 [Trichomalopsis sarcophagae]|uniref:Mitogen-activated protein kinase kinase kinase N-terminal domain-containing protein n=1 Tax=Trichomalopsis sarcophagae TaxID=543379 RepID=A0A232F3L8_9HYME|nr:hypothetical protein TSAR_011183 [Trichomalopsis sarcophagae]
MESIVFLKSKIPDTNIEVNSFVGAKFSAASRTRLRGAAATLDLPQYKIGFDAATMLTNETSKLNSSVGKIDVQLCGGCLSMYCQDCTCAQSEALKQVENLLTRLEAAEGLFPSLQAFSLQHPIYRSSNFTGRIKAMCLWYNMTKNHRLKLIILGRLLTLLHRNKKQDDCSLLDCTFRF